MKQIEKIINTFIPYSIDFDCTLELIRYYLQRDIAYGLRINKRIQNTKVVY